MRQSWQELFRSTVRRDFDALTSSLTALALLLLMPLVLLLAIEREEADHAARVLVAGSAADHGVTDRLVLVMGESSQMEVKRVPRPVPDPLARIKAEHLDILVNYETYKDEEPRAAMYTAETDPRRLAELENLGAGISRAQESIAHRMSHGETPQSTKESWWARSDIYQDLNMLGPLPIQPLTEYFPQAANPRVAMLPPVMLLMVSFLPFALAVAVARSDQAAPSHWSEALTRTAAAAVVPAGVAMADLLAVLLAGEYVLDVHVKSGVFRMALLVFAAVLGSALAGLLAVALSRTRIKLAAWCTWYALLAGVLIAPGTPLNERQPWVQAFAQILPATHLRPVLTGWLFGAPYDLSALWAGLVMLALAMWFWIFAAMTDWVRVSADVPAPPIDVQVASSPVSDG